MFRNKKNDIQHFKNNRFQDDNTDDTLIMLNDNSLIMTRLSTLIKESKQFQQQIDTYLSNRWWKKPLPEKRRACPSQAGKQHAYSTLLGTIMLFATITRALSLDTKNSSHLEEDILIGLTILFLLLNSINISIVAALTYVGLRSPNIDSKKLFEFIENLQDFIIQNKQGFTKTEINGLQNQISTLAELKTSDKKKYDSLKEISLVLKGLNRRNTYSDQEVYRLFHNNDNEARQRLQAPEISITPQFNII